MTLYKSMTLVSKVFMTWTFSNSVLILKVLISEEFIDPMIEVLINVLNHQCDFALLFRPDVYILHCF